MAASSAYEPIPDRTGFPSPQPPQYYDRRQWLVVFGVFEILIACFFLILAMGMIILVPNLPKVENQLPLPSATFYMAALFYAAVAAFFVTIGIGSIQARNWARIAMIVTSSLWLVLGVFSTAVSLLILPSIMRQGMPQSGQLPPNFQNIVFVFSVFFQVFTMVLLPLGFLLFYSSKHVKASCDGRTASPQSAAKRPPISVIVLTVWFCFIALSGLGAATWFPATIVFGYFITGLPARLIGLVFFAISAYCAWNLYKLRPQGWVVATAASALWFLSGLMTRIRLDAKTLYAKTYEHMGLNPQQTPLNNFPPETLAIFFFAGLLISLAFFALVLYTKRYFPARQEAVLKA